MNKRQTSMDDLNELIDSFVDYPFDFQNETIMKYDLITSTLFDQQQLQQQQQQHQHYHQFQQQQNNYNFNLNNNNYNQQQQQQQPQQQQQFSYSPLSLSLDRLISDDFTCSYSYLMSNNQTTNLVTTPTPPSQPQPPPPQPTPQSSQSLSLLQSIPTQKMPSNLINTQQQKQQLTTNTTNLLAPQTPTTPTTPTHIQQSNNNGYCTIPPLPQLSISPSFFNTTLHQPSFYSNQNPTMKTFLDTERETICINPNSGLSRSNSQPDLTASEKTPTQLKVRRHPSLSCKTSMSECSEEFYVDLNENNTTTTTDDGIFLGTDAISDFLSAGTFSDILDDLPDLEGLMSVVTFDHTPWPQRFTQCDINLDDTSTTSNVSTDCMNNGETSRITRSAPPSPTPTTRKKRSQNWPFHKSWSKMTNEEHVSAVECLTSIINDEMGLREQLEIIRIINPDAKLLRTDTQFVIDLNMIDDDKFRRIREIIKLHGLKLNEKQISDNCSECSANSCPQGYKMNKRELRLRRAQQRLIKQTQRKETRQILKESKSGLFIKTEVIPLSQVLPEEDIEVDILS